MLNQKRRLASAAIGMGLAIVAAGCGTTTVSKTPPNPFTVVARWSAASLGLSFGVHDANSLAIGPDGNLYVTDLSNRVTVISPEGNVLFRWGGKGTGPSQFRFVSVDPSDPRDIHGSLAVDSHGLVYVSDSGNFRVQVFKADGSFVRQFGSFGDGPGQFRSPFELAVDVAGNVYVVDDQLPGVLNKFSPSGRLVWQIGGATSPDQYLHGYLHLGNIDQHDRLVIWNEDTGIVYLDEDGHKIDAFDPGGPGGTGSGLDPTLASGWCEVSVDALGNTFLTGCGPPNALAEVFDKSHALIGEWDGGDEGLAIAPRFGPNGEVFALGWDGSLLKLRITLPQA